MMDNGFNNYPIGSGMALMLNQQALDRYDNLTEAEKEDIIFRCKDAKSKEEADEIMNSLPSSDRISGLFDGPGIG